MKKFLDALAGFVCFFVVPCVDWPAVLARIF